MQNALDPYHVLKEQGNYSRLQFTSSLSLKRYVGHVFVPLLLDTILSIAYLFLGKGRGTRQISSFSNSECKSS